MKAKPFYNRKSKVGLIKDLLKLMFLYRLYYRYCRYMLYVEGRRSSIVFNKIYEREA
jgi:hypothetical protein